MNTNIENVIFDPPLISTKTIESIEAERKNPEYLSIYNPAVESTGSGLSVLSEFVMARKSKVIGILGDTSHGKTSIMTDIARNMTAQIDAENGEIGLFVTWEDNIEDFGIVDIANHSKIPVSKLYNGFLDGDEFDKMMNAASKRAQYPLWIAGHSETSLSRPMLTMTDVFEICENLVVKQKRRIRFVMLDYLQRINRSDTKERDTRMQFVSVMDKVKNLALSYSTCVFIGSQVRRDKVESTKWRQPQAHWAMETSNFEHSCDGMMSVWMPYKSKDQWKVGDCLQEKQGVDGEAIFVSKELMLIEILKQKKGSTGILKAVDFIPEYGMFVKYNTAEKVRKQIKEERTK